MVAAHLRTFWKECDSFAHTFSPGKRFHLRTQFPQVNVTFAHIRFSHENGMYMVKTSQALNFIPSYTPFFSHFQKGVRQTDGIQGTASDERAN